MAKDDTVDWEAETNPSAKAVVDHFMASDLKESDLKEYAELKFEADRLSELIEQKRKLILEKCKGMESAKAGNYVAFLKAVKGRESTDWKRYVSDVVGKVSDADLATYTKRSEDSIRLEVKKL
jgi:hypothetical protein